ncbi:MAG: hypothetical protein H6716_27010 [Polyangiaceae bacterium]|nr:hypothetical protein [Polyangiaceae bacterium]MCB9610267.1 hypothetical protein [Polyangiaceae bacterium]
MERPKFEDPEQAAVEQLKLLRKAEAPADTTALLARVEDALASGVKLPPIPTELADEDWDAPPEEVDAAHEATPQAAETEPRDD